MFLVTYITLLFDVSFQFTNLILNVSDLLGEALSQTLHGLRLYFLHFIQWNKVIIIRTSSSTLTTLANSRLQPVFNNYSNSYTKLNPCSNYQINYAENFRKILVIHISEL